MSARGAVNRELQGCVSQPAEVPDPVLLPDPLWPPKIPGSRFP